MGKYLILQPLRFLAATCSHQEGASEFKDKYSVVMWLVDRM
jgi:hypothetical protein